jgi:chloride channel protein, CIC family
MKPNNNILFKILRWRYRNIDIKLFLIILSIVIGICSGIAAVILKSLAHYIRQQVISAFDNPYENYLFFAFPFIGIFITVLFFKFFVRDKAGHGVSSILYAISRRKGKLRPHKMYSAVVGSSFTVGFGGSVGLEAPVVSTGAAIGSNIGSLFKLNYKQITLLIGCGAAGAISAIFNAPVAALVFALEVLMLDLTLPSLIPLLMASVTGTITANLLIGEEILFSFNIQDPFAFPDVPFYLLLGIFCGLVSIYFTRSEIFFEKKIKKIKNDYLRALAGGIILGAVIFLFPPLYGEGYESITSLLAEAPGRLLSHTFIFDYYFNELIVLAFILVVLLIKPIATALTIGSGGSGGIFAPSLFIGGLAGFFFAKSLNLYLPFSLSESNFTLAGMSGLMAGVLHAPLTALFLIAELTGGYQLIVPLMITSGLAMLTAKFFEPHSIYTKRLAQEGQLITHDKDKAALTLMNMKDVIENDFECISPDHTLGELVKVIAKSKRNIFPVVDEENYLLGIVLLDDIRETMFNQQLYEKIKVEDLMVLAPGHISISDSMENVMKVFAETGAWNLPVLDEGKYSGFISKSKLFSNYRKILVQFSED